MYNRRCLSTVVAVFLLLLAVTGGIANAKVKITYAGWAPGSVADLERGIVANFMAENPDIEVDYIPVAWSGEPAYAEKISTWAASGTLPDVLKVPYTLINDFVKGRMMLDVTHLVARDAKILNFDDLPIREHCLINGHWYGLTATHSLYWLKVNETLFADTGLQSPFDTLDRGGWNWSYLITAAKRMTSYTSDGKIISLGITGPWSRFFDSPFIQQAGGAWFDSNYTKATFDTPAAMQGFQLLRDMALEDKSFVWDQQSASVSTTGKLGMQFGWNLTWGLPEGTKYVWQPEFIPMPLGPQNAATTYSAHLIGVTTQSKQQEAAWRFTVYYNSIKTAEPWASGFSLTPDRPSQWSMFFATAKKLWPMKRGYDYMLRQYSQIVLDPSPPNNSAIRNAIDKYLKPGMLGQKPLREAVDETVRQIDILLK